MNKLGRKKALLYGLIITAALFGLIIDRLSREGVPAAASAPANPGAGIPARSAVVNATEASEGPILARIFEAEAPPASGPAERRKRGNLRDAFALTPQMRRLYEKESLEKQADAQKKAQAEKELREQEMDRFQSSHQLKGTTLQDGDAWAIIDDKVMRPGDRIDGFELKKIERYRVLMVKADMTVVLSLPLP